VTLARFITSLSIPQVGEETARDLALYFGTAEKLARAILSELEILNGVGPVVAHAIVEWFADKENKKLFQNLLKQVNIKSESNQVLHHVTLAGKSFVLTGTLEGMSREEAKGKIRQLGGKISTSVSRNTSYLICGRDPGEKLTQAQALGVKVLFEKEFSDMLG
jgi:DNA ligase (NAD+)